MPKTMDNVNNNTFLGTVYWSYCCIHQRPYIESHDKYAYSKLSFLFVANEKKKKHRACAMRLSQQSCRRYNSSGMLRYVDW